MSTFIDELVEDVPSLLVEDRFLSVKSGCIDPQQR